MTTPSTKALTDDQLRAELAKLREMVVFLEGEMHARGMHSDRRRLIRVEQDPVVVNTERLAVQARLTDLSPEGVGCILEDDLLVTVDLSEIGITEPVVSRIVWAFRTEQGELRAGLEHVPLEEACRRGFPVEGEVPDTDME